MSSKKPKISNGLERKTFQKAISNLKKSGLVPKTLDVRKVEQTKHYTGLIRKYKDIASGAAVAAPIHRKEFLNTYKERGDELFTKGKKVFIKGNQTVNEKGQILNQYTLKVNKKGEVIRKYKKVTPDGRTIYVTQKELPIKFENIEQWLNDLKNQDFKLKQGEKVIFKLFGNFSREAYTTFDQAFKKFMTYDAVIQAKDGTMSQAHVSELVKSVGFEKISGGSAKTYNRDRIVDLNKQFSKKDKKRYLSNAVIFPPKPKSK